MRASRYKSREVQIQGAPRRDLVVRSLSQRATRGVLSLGGFTVRCALGRTGKRARKREGDGATPIGIWAVGCVRYRADRGLRPLTTFAAQPIRLTDGWCDDVADRNYNRPVAHPYPASAEHMWRVDELYDIVVILGHNDRPRVRGHGSAIFMHVARSGWTPTQGCIALCPRDLRLVLQWLRPGSRIRVPA